MTQPQTPQEWIERHRQSRVTEGVSLAEQDMLQALAGVVAADRLNRVSLGPGNDKGRSPFVWTGEPTEAEQHWVQALTDRKT